MNKNEKIDEKHATIFETLSWENTVRYRRPKNTAQRNPRKRAKKSTNSPVTARPRYSDDADEKNMSAGSTTDEDPMSGEEARKKSGRHHKRPTGSSFRRIHDMDFPPGSSMHNPPVRGGGVSHGRGLHHGRGMFEPPDHDRSYSTIGLNPSYPTTDGSRVSGHHQHQDSIFIPESSTYGHPVLGYGSQQSIESFQGGFINDPNMFARPEFDPHIYERPRFGPQVYERPGFGPQVYERPEFDPHIYERTRNPHPRIVPGVSVQDFSVFDRGASQGQGFFQGSPMQALPVAPHSGYHPAFGVDMYSGYPPSSGHPQLQHRTTGFAISRQASFAPPLHSPPVPMPQISRPAVGMSTIRETLKRRHGPVAEHQQTMQGAKPSMSKKGLPELTQPIAEKGESSRSSSYSSRLLDFRREMQHRWNGDPDIRTLVNIDREEDAVEQFRGATMAMSSARDISEDDTADIFQLVTGFEL